MRRNNLKNILLISIHIQLQLIPFRQSEINEMKEINENNIFWNLNFASQEKIRSMKKKIAKDNKNVYDDLNDAKL
jgi:hypothetical protein